MIKLIRFMGDLLLWMGVAIIVLGYAAILYHDDWFELWAVFSPVMLWNAVAVVLILSPGLGLRWLARSAGG